MSRGLRITIVSLVVVAAVAVMALRDDRGTGTGSDSETTLPRLVELGSDKCTQCKLMKPIIDGLREEYAGRMAVDFIDVFKVEGSAKAYNVDVIPTQIFFAADGTELYRHTGFYSSQEIMAKWTEHGVEF